MDFVADYCSLTISDEPRSITEARSRADATEWEKAATEEMQSLKNNKTWDVVDLPAGRSAIGCRWVFKLKRKADGTIDRYKARLVAQGFLQKKGIDFDETYAPVSKLPTIRTLITYGVKLGMEIHQMDVSAAYLNGVLEEEIYMRQVEGFELPRQEGKVLRLKKAIYGLKQSGRTWYTRLTNELCEKAGYKRIHSDYGVYVSRNYPRIILVIYVDDILIIAKTEENMQVIKQRLSSSFKMKDMGRAKSFLGINIWYDKVKKQAILSQEGFTKEILERFGMTDSKTVRTPIDSNKFYSRGEDEESFNKIDYIRAIGALMYLSQATRPDLAYAVSFLSRFSSDPSFKHWQAVKRVFRYLNGTVYHGLSIKASNEELKIVGFADADYAGDETSRKSTSGYVFLMNEACISWSSKKQSSVALSTTESELIAATFAAREAIWLKRLMEEIGENIGTIRIGVDNNSVLQLIANPVFHARTKHIDVAQFFIREKVEEKEIQVERVDTTMNCADIFTKPISKTTLEKHCKILSVNTGDKTEMI